MLVGRVPGHQVEQYADAAPVRLREEPAKVLVRPVPRRDLFVIPHVVSRVFERRIEARVDPEGIAPEAADVIEAPDDARQVADAVAVGVLKGLRVDLIENGVFQPFRGHAGPSFFRYGTVNTAML